jgi:polyhydroxyalkanoate synthase subunit PhaC
MTDTEAFELGKNVATTPGKVVFQNDLMQLIQSRRPPRRSYKRPLLIVPPWINKYYILDLREKNSFIKWAVDQGHTVFVISWVNPDSKLAQKTFEDYVLRRHAGRARRRRTATGEKEVNADRLLPRRHAARHHAGLSGGQEGGQRPRRARTFFTTMLDFSEPGELGVFIDEQQVAALEKKMSGARLPRRLRDGGTFNMLRANDLIWSFVVNNYLMGKDPFPFDLLYWNSDSTRMPAKMHSFYLRNMYMENLLRSRRHHDRRCRSTCARSRRRPTSSRPSKITSPRGRAPTSAPSCCRPGPFVLGGSGHIAGIVNPPAANKYGYWTEDTTGQGHISRAVAGKPRKSLFITLD